MTFKDYWKHVEVPGAPNPLGLMSDRRKMRYKLYNILGVGSYREMPGLTVNWTDHLGENLTGEIINASEEAFIVRVAER